MHDALVDKIAERARAIRLGDPRAAETEMGPVATEPQYRKVLSFLDSAATEGATVAAAAAPTTRSAASSSSRRCSPGSSPP